MDREPSEAPKVFLAAATVARDERWDVVLAATDTGLYAMRDDGTRLDARLVLEFEGPIRGVDVRGDDLALATSTGVVLARWRGGAWVWEPDVAQAGGEALDVTWAPGGTRLSATFTDDSVRVWSAQGKRHLPITVRVLRDFARRMSFVGKGDHVLTVGDEGTARLTASTGRRPASGSLLPA